MVNQEILDKFKKLYLEKYNIELTQEEATKLATQFLSLMEILITPKPKVNNLPQEHAGHNL